jgi:hypothetical protein
MTQNLRLGFERLETRDVPASLWYAQNFDTTPLGSLPANWSQWTNDAVPSFAASNDRSLSAPESLRSAGISSRMALTWLNQAAPADMQVSASIFADSLVPTRLFVRGSNLQTGAPTYYSVTLTRGLSIEVQRVVAGTETRLAQLNSTAYTSGVWIRLSFASQNFKLSIQAERLDTNQFLGADGRWTATPSDAIALKDGMIGGAGFAGIGRPARYAGDVAIDNFQIDTFGDTQAPIVAIRQRAADVEHSP